MRNLQQAIVDQITSELRRLDAEDARIRLDHDFEPETGPLIRLQIGDPYWHLMSVDLVRLLEALPDRAGSDAIQQTIEQNATFVWHGPAPTGSRDTSF